ncbi:MAG: gfo/Idh/MocA family oxidoreductase, partial [Clostridia bacterium]|nr:gfo/Idh/MocA family oxidoreductase [Clostridia bacterium]
DPHYFEMDGKPAEYADLFGVEDFAAGFVRLEGGIILDFRIAWAMHLDTSGDTIIMGKKGSLRIPSTECWNGSIGGPMTIYSEVAGSQIETKIPMVTDNSKGNFYKKIRAVVVAVATGGKAPVPTSQILYNQAIIDGIVKSAKIGKEIEIEIPEI